MEDLCAHPQRLAEVRRAPRLDHEFLEIHVVVGVLAAVEDVHHRYGQRVGRGAAQVAIQRQSRPGGRGLGHRRGHRQERVGAQLAFVGRAVQLDHAAVDFFLEPRVDAGQRRSDDLVDVLHRLEDALAEVAPLVAVAQLDRLILARGGAAGHGGGGEGTVGQDDVGFHRRISAGIEDLPGVNGLDRGGIGHLHYSFGCVLGWVGRGRSGSTAWSGGRRLGTRDIRE